MSYFISCIYCHGSIPFGDREAMDKLGITAEQLKIARALDREKIETLRMVITSGICHSCYVDCGGKGLLSMLPTFGDKPECGHEYHREFIGDECWTGYYVCEHCGEKKT